VNDRPRLTVKALRRRRKQLEQSLLRVIPNLEAACNANPSGDHPELSETVENLLEQLDMVDSELPTEPCPTHCPLNGSASKHDHFVFRPNNLFFGALAELATESEGRSFDFDFDRKDDGGKSSLRRLVSENKIYWAYLPVQLFGQACGLSGRQIRAFQGIVREKSRPLKKSKNGDTIVRAGMIRAVRGNGLIRCPLLDTAKAYVSFGGNFKSHHSRGYQIVGRLGNLEDSSRLGGWLRRLGYPAHVGMDVERIWNWVGVMLNDLRELTNCFDLTIIALDKNGTFLSLNEVIDRARQHQHRSLLNTCSLRIFGPADYLTRWRHWFSHRLGYSYIPGGSWSEPDQCVEAEIGMPSISSVKETLRKNQVPQKMLALALGWPQSKVSRQLAGKLNLSRELVEAVRLLCASES